MTGSSGKPSDEAIYAPPISVRGPKRLGRGCGCLALLGLGVLLVFYLTFGPSARVAGRVHDKIRPGMTPGEVFAIAHEVYPKLWVNGTVCSPDGVPVGRFQFLGSAAFSVTSLQPEEKVSGATFDRPEELVRAVRELNLCQHLFLSFHVPPSKGVSFRVDFDSGRKVVQVSPMQGLD